MTTDLNRFINIQYCSGNNRPFRIMHPQSRIMNHYTLGRAKLGKVFFDRHDNLTCHEQYYGDLVIINGRDTTTHFKAFTIEHYALNLQPAITIEIMHVIKKGDFIHSCLHRAHESTINNFYEKLRHEEVLKGKLESREKNRRKIFNQGIFSRG
jgi:hypothetical protein